MIGYPFEKCKKCINPIRLVDIHGKTIGRRCYYQLDSMKEWWDKEDCEHFFEPKTQTSVLGEALRYAEKKRKQCPEEELWFPCCRNCMEWYDCYQENSVSSEPSCFCISIHSEEMSIARLIGQKDCPHRVPY